MDVKIDKLMDFLTPVFFDDGEKKNFIKRCLAKNKTSRMLWTVLFYLEIADGQEKIRKGYPALKLIFLMAMAESVTKQKLPKNKIGHFRAIEEFFQCLREEDKKRLINSFKPAITKSQNFRFSSILKILYEVRNRAVHGEDYYSFDLLNQKDKDRHWDYNDFGIMTSGYLGKPNKKRRISLDINLTYEELREIFIRTAIRNIQSLL